MKTCSKTGCVARALSPTRRLSPAEHRLPFLLRDLRNQFLDLPAVTLVVREEDQSRAVGASLGKRERHVLPEEAIGGLNQNAGTVTGVRFAAAGAAVLQIDQDTQRLPHDVMRALPLHMHDEADAARVALVEGVVQTLTGVRRHL